MDDVADSQLYRLPLYYDVAFSWDPTREIVRFTQCIRTHAGISVSNLLEPGCGTGRFLMRMPSLGFRVTGYDKCPEMLAFARERIGRAEFGNRVRVVEADMRTAEFDETFDAAYNAVNTVGYLLSDADIAEHLVSMAGALRPGAVYVVQLACGWEGEEVEPPDEWICERDGVRVAVRWSIVSEDYERRLSRQMCRMEITDHGRREVVEDPHLLRLWVDEDILRLAAESGAFERVGVYTLSGEKIPPGVRVTGRMGNLYHVFRRL